MCFVHVSDGRARRHLEHDRGRTAEAHVQFPVLGLPCRDPSCHGQFACRVCCWGLTCSRLRLRGGKREAGARVGGGRKGGDGRVEPLSATLEHRRCSERRAGRESRRQVHRQNDQDSRDVALCRLRSRGLRTWLRRRKQSVGRMTRIRHHP
jgi:hypothetical protein